MAPTSLVWSRRRSTGSSADTHIYNVSEGVIIVERAKCRQKNRSNKQQSDTVQPKDMRKPLLDRVKHTRLSCFRSLGAPGTTNTTTTALDQTEPNISSACECKCDLDVMQRVNPYVVDENVQSCIKYSCKSSGLKQSDNPDISAEDIQKNVMFDIDTIDRGKYSPKAKRKSKKLVDKSEVRNGSCFSTKFKAISEKYLHSSTNRFVAKLYKHNSGVKNGESSDTSSKCKSKNSKVKLRSFSYGALPGLEEFQKRHNPLYQEEDTINPFKDVDDLSQHALLIDTEDCDSGILVSDSTTSSVLDSDHGAFRCDSAASSSYSAGNSSQTDNRNSSFLYSHHSSPWSPMNISVDKTEQTTREEYSPRHHNTHRVRSLDRREVIRKTPVATNSSSPENYRHPSEVMLTPPSRNSTPRIPTEVKFIRIDRSSSSEDLGIFISKKNSSGYPGYVVAHIVPNSLADK